jgi:hypothetical protein
MKNYEVNIIYKGQTNYIVKANNEEEATELAEALYKEDTPGITLGTEYEEIENIEVYECPSHFTEMS